jgi:hypothetical protein
MNGKRWAWGLTAQLLLPSMGTVAFAQGNQPSGYADQVPTGTTDPTGSPERQGGTITSQGGNVSNAKSPAGTDPTASPANRHPYNDRNYREGTPGTSSPGQMRTQGDLRQGGNRSTLGTAAPADISGTAPGLTPPSGQTGSSGVGLGNSPSGNPGPTGNAQTPVAAPTSGPIGTSGSGAGGAPGAITNAGTHGINGSGR